MVRKLHPGSLSKIDGMAVILSVAVIGAICFPWYASYGYEYSALEIGNKNHLGVATDFVWQFLCLAFLLSICGLSLAILDRARTAGAFYVGAGFATLIAYLYYRLWAHFVFYSSRIQGWGAVLGFFLALGLLGLGYFKFKSVSTITTNPTADFRPSAATT